MRARGRLGWVLLTILLTFIVGAAVGGSVGWWIGVSSAPFNSLVAADECETSPGALASDTDTGGEPSRMSEALSLSFLANVRLAGDLAALEQLLDELQAARVRPEWAAAELVARMDPAHLEHAVGAAVGLTDRERGQLEDPEAYALRLIDVALEGIDTDDDELEDRPDGVVHFSTERQDFDPQVDARDRFDVEDGRIYALFQSERGRVTVRWTRIDRPEVLLLERTTVTRQPSYGWVYLEPSSGWAAGQYQVTVYTGDEALTPLAVGRYVVTDLDAYAIE